MFELSISNEDEVHRSTYTLPDGTVLLKTETPRALGSRTTSILKLLPSDIPGQDGGARYGIIAGIDWKSGLNPHMIRYGGQELEANELLKKEGSGMKWNDLGRDRVFTAPNGKKYRWKSQTDSSKLVSYDDKEQIIAQSHRRKWGVFHKKSPAKLEIMPEGEDMLDLVLVTFVYIEKIRKETETAVATSG